MYLHALRAGFNLFVRPEGMGGVVVQDDKATGSHKQLPGDLIGNGLYLVYEQAVTGGAVYLRRGVRREEFDYTPVREGVDGFALAPTLLVPIVAEGDLEVTDSTPFEVWECLGDYGGYGRHFVLGGEFKDAL